MLLAAGLISARLLHYAGTLSLFGAALFPFYADARSRPFVSLADAQLRRLFPIEAGLALVGGVAWFLFTAASMAGDIGSAVDPHVLLNVVQATDFGPIWLARLALVALVLVIQLAWPLWRWSGLVTLVASGLALATLAMTGHGRAPEGWSGIAHALSDAAHLLAAGVWLGALLPLGAALGAARRIPTSPDDAVGELLARFSAVGISAVAVIVATGIINSWYLVGSVSGLVGTAYGRLLLIKIALFLLMVGVAAANRLWITPAFTSGRAAGDSRWLRRIQRHVLIEQALGLAILAAVSILGTLPTPLDG